MKKFLPVFVLSALCFSSAAFALNLPEKPDHYVNDYVGLLSADASARIENSLSEFEKATSNQLVVAIFDTLDGGSLEDFSIRLAEKWKIGQKDKNNGIILLIFKSDRKVRIEVGYGLEGALPDVVANQIIQNEIVPQFRAGNYSAGVEKAVAAIMAATRNEYTAPARTNSKNSPLNSLFLLALFTFFTAPIICYGVVIVLCMLFFGMMPGLAAGVVLAALLALFRAAVFSGYPGTTYSSRGPGAFGGLSSGSGSGFSLGGGFGGGGGGSFGGGGSSGSW